MQKISKASIKKTFAHTWYLYPLACIIVVLLWLWAFPAYHQPSAHQRLQVFYATDVKNTSFARDIKKNYTQEELREVSTTYALPSNVLYPKKLQIAVNYADILVLDRTTFVSFEGHFDNYFVAINDSTKTEYLDDNAKYYTSNENTYGVLIKEKEQTCWLSDYMTFDDTQDYFLALSVTSKNLGSLLDEKNAHYDNALTFMSYLYKGL